MGNFVESGKKINCYSFFYCSTCFCELILEALSRGPVDSRHFVLPTFCAVWREKLFMELLHPPNCGGSNLLTAQKNISPKAKRELFPHFSLKNLVFLWLRDKRKCCLPSGGFVHTGPACGCRQEAPVCSSPIHLLTTAAGTICYTQEHKYTNAGEHQYKKIKIQNVLNNHNKNEPLCSPIHLLVYTDNGSGHKYTNTKYYQLHTQKKRHHK